ncbi:hypothetical protein D3C75_942820 [compost metagenome]
MAQLEYWQALEDGVEIEQKPKKKKKKNKGKKQKKAEAESASIITDENQTEVAAKQNKHKSA